jgi:DNA-binding NarL/FixJ family response regulator
MITVLQPHLQRAYANAQLVTQNLCKPSLQRSITLQDLGLTIKESAVASWLAEGKTNREIGLILGTAARTVEKHVEKILRKLRVENRTAAAIEIGRIVH